MAGRARAYHVGVAGVLRERHPATDAALVRVVEQQGLQLLLQLLEPRHREARHHSRRRTPANGSGSGSHTGQRQPPKGRESSTAGSEEEGEGHERLEIGRTCGSGSGSGDGGLGSEGIRAGGGALVWLARLAASSARSVGAGEGRIQVDAWIRSHHLSAAAALILFNGRAKWGLPVHSKCQI